MEEPQAEGVAMIDGLYAITLGTIGALGFWYARTPWEGAVAALLLIIASAVQSFWRSWAMTHTRFRGGLAIDLNEIRRALKLEAAPLEQMREDVVVANEQAGLGVADFINAALVLEAIGGAIWVAVSRS